MHMRTSPRAWTLLVCFAAASVLFAGCGEDPVAADDTLTDADAASLIAMSYARSGGFLLNLGNAIDVSRGGPITDLQRRKDPGGAIILHDTTFTRNKSVTVEGKEYSYAMTVKSTFAYTSNGFNNPRENFFTGNTELKFSAAMKGTVTKPTLVATDSAWCSLFINRTDSTYYTMSGKFGRVGVYTFPGTPKVYTGSIETANIPGAIVDKAGRLIDDSNAANIEVNLRGTDQKGNTIRVTGLIIARHGTATKINVNGRIYTVNLESGTAAAQ